MTCVHGRFTRNSHYVVPVFPWRSESRLRRRDLVKSGTTGRLLTTLVPPRCLLSCLAPKISVFRTLCLERNSGLNNRPTGVYSMNCGVDAFPLLPGAHPGLVSQHHSFLVSDVRTYTCHIWHNVTYQIFDIFTRCLLKRRSENSKGRCPVSSRRSSVSRWVWQETHCHVENSDEILPELLSVTTVEPEL